MRLGDENSLFEAIEIFESKFAGWLKSRLEQRGIFVEENIPFKEVLKQYENNLNGDSQHVNPLMNWAREKEKCTNLKGHLNSGNFLEKSEFDFLEKTAMNGAVLLLTFQNN